MSYSFNVKAANKAAAKAAVASKLEEVANGQACHQRDKDQALAAASAFIDLVRDDDSHDVAVTVSGHLAGTWQGSDVVEISSAAVSVQAGLVTRG